MPLLHLLAQTDASNWITPISGATLLGILSLVLKWMMSTYTQELKEIKTVHAQELNGIKTAFQTELKNLTTTLNEHSRTLDRSMFLNSKATLMMGLKVKSSNAELDIKLQECMSELEAAEARKNPRKDNDG